MYPDRVYNKRDDYSNFLRSKLDVKGKFVLVVTVAPGMRELKRDSKIENQIREKRNETVRTTGRTLIYLV